MAIKVMLLAMALSHDSMAFGAGTVGINYGRLGNNLPPPARVVEFLTKDLNYAIPSVRIFDPEPEVLSALATSNLSVCLGVKNQDLAQMAGSMDYTRNWVREFVTPYTKGGNGTLKLRYITAGNEIIPGTEAVYVLPAMKNIQQVLEQENVPNVGVSTVLSAAALGSSYPPSNGSFATEVATTLNEISKFVYSKGAPLMINVYPYFTLASDPQQVTLDYASFRSTTPVAQDGDRNYFNLFDSIVDSFIAAMVKAVGKEDVKVVVTETGWPSAGSNLPHASVENAKTYNSNLKKHIQTLGGTPRRPNLNLETFIFALFNENQKPEGTEQNFGSFYPNLQEVYPLWR
ncbi:hypothetical protein CISIN_1g043818mg [Citrus sinensis]|uniref:glucan endo-1,3-beta-D-glucosidase n=2 Tax=Citrus sinensis TaxID=2711 RepID=A0A067G4Q9_CITSI|nr:hypothetical protein CISIN_1g043818mg [Citrus sinensis]